MKRNRFIQFVTLLIGLGCLVGAALLLPLINQERTKLFPREIVKNADPKQTLLAAALGSFRGLAVDALWYRSEMLKRAGKFYEAKTLSDWITTLQPRFPQVWRFQAWNMAYNISVATHTPQERWDWVSKGIRLLREKGIPYNPNSVPLYRELSWEFFHKIGMYSDDMNWYYKLRLAERWQELLGAPAAGATTAQALARFKPIADDAERYFSFDKPALSMRQALSRLAKSYPAYASRLESLKKLSLVAFTRRIADLRGELTRKNQDLAQALEPLQRQAQHQLERASRDPLTLLFEDHPETRPLVGALKRLGLDLNARTLRGIGRIKMLIRYTSQQAIEQRASQLFNPTDQKSLALITNPDNGGAWKALLPWWRAKALIKTYHMNPVKMYELMQFFGPLDWRHPASHAAYWAWLGVEKSGGLRDKNKYDILNTDRQVIQSMQMLFNTGRVSFDPLSNHVDYLPDPRFAPAYDKAMKQAIARQKKVKWHGGGNVTSFEAGHQNFLLKAMVYSYLYGDMGQAKKWYAEVRRLYGDKPQNVRSGRYLLPLDELVVKEYKNISGAPNSTRAMLDALLQRAFTQGLANGSVRIFNRFVRIAKHVHADYQKKRGTATPTAPRERMLMLPFDQVLAQSYAAYMRLPNVPLMQRVRVYRNTPPGLQLAAYDKFHAEVAKAARRQQLDPQRLFPPPPGYEAKENKATPRNMFKSIPKSIERK